MDLTKLYPHQHTNSDFLAARISSADLSEVGTGKTITALATMAKIRADNMLIVAPKSVVSGWEKKFHEFWPEVAVFRAKKSDKQSRLDAYNAYFEAFRAQRGPIALIVTYEQVRMDISVLERFRYDVTYADEIHKIGNPLAGVSKAMAKLPSKRRFGATATPMRSSPLQAFGVFSWLAPGLLGKNYWSFQARYVIKNKQKWIVGYQNLDEIGMKIKPYYCATTMEESGIYMPPLVEEDLIFSLGKKEEKLYDQIRKQMLLEIDKLLINKMENPVSLNNGVVNIGKLQELTDSMELLGEGEDSAKLKFLKDHLENTLASDNKAVIFTRFSRMAHILVRELAEYKPALIVGGVLDRQAEIDKLDNDPECKVMVVTTAGNEGIDLQRANIMYMYDVPLGSYGSLVQTRGRIRRAGQTKNMVIYYLMATYDGGRSTVDIKLRNLLMKKAEMSDQIFGNEVRELLV